MWPSPTGGSSRSLAAPADRRTAVLAAARLAVAQLGKVTTVPDMVAHHDVAVAYLRHLAGDHDGALDALATGDRVLRRADTPSAEYEAARLRARALTAQGLNAGAIAQVRAAGSLADDTWLAAPGGLAAGGVPGGVHRPSGQRSPRGPQQRHA